MTEINKNDFMKIKLFKGKLNLKKETVTKLNKDQMNKIVGGVDTVKATADSIASIEKAKADSIA